MDIKPIFLILKRSCDLRNMDELESICDEFVKLIGLQYFQYTHIERTSLYSPVVTTLTNLPKSLWEVSSESRSYMKSFVLDLMDKNRPEAWVLCGDRDVSLGGRVKKVFFDSKVSMGLSVPLMSASGEYFVFNVFNGDECCTTDDLSYVLPFAHTFVANISSQMTKIKDGLTSPKSSKILTQREMDCLFWACEGKTAWEISQITGISERTVIFHLNNSASKLSAKNRQHAVVIAVTKGIIKPNILRMQLSA